MRQYEQPCQITDQGIILCGLYAAVYDLKDSHLAAIICWASSPFRLGSLRFTLIADFIPDGPANGSISVEEQRVRS